MESSHKKRVFAELHKANMTSYGFVKHETSYVPKIVHEDEHVHGVIYGRLEDTLDSVMLVATDKRILFIDCKPFYRYWDEITYEVVAGVKMSTVGPFAGVVLHTRVKEYSLRFVNIKCAKVFVAYIEAYIEKGEVDTTPVITGEPEKKKPKFQPYKMDNSPDPKEHSNENTTVLDDTAVLSTTNRTGVVRAAVVHYIIDKDENFYFLTKSDTRKAQNIDENPNVALTIHPSQSLKVLYVEGTAEHITKEITKQQIYDHIAQPHEYDEGIKLPPVTKIEAGAYVAYKITPTRKDMQDYGETSW